MAEIVGAKEAFLAAFAKTGNISVAAQAANVDRTTAWYWRKDPEFRAKFREARRESVEYMEAEALRRAMHGTRRPIFQGGKKVGEELVYSDPLLMFLLRAAKPKKYRENLSHEISGRGGGPVQVQARALPATDALMDPEVYAKAKAYAQALEEAKDRQALPAAEDKGSERADAQP